LNFGERFTSRGNKQVNVVRGFGFDTGKNSLFQKPFCAVANNACASPGFVGITTIACVSFGLESGLLRGILTA
jgi:hypothetical protein